MISRRFSRQKTYEAGLSTSIPVTRPKLDTHRYTEGALDALIKIPEIQLNCLCLKP